MFSTLLKRVSLIGCVMALGACSTTPFYTFNIEPTGHIAGWTAVGIRDDQGSLHAAPDGSALLKLFFADQHEAPTYFPCTASTPATCDSIKGYGSLGIALPQGSVLKQAGFPDGSLYWQVDVLSPVLPLTAQGMTGLQAYVGDLYGVYPGQVSASLFVLAEVGGAVQEILPVGGATFSTVSKTAWTVVSLPFALPTGAVPRHWGVRLRGVWKGQQAYDGALFVDNVGLTK